MAYVEPLDLQPQQALPGRTRTILARRLADIVCLPSSRIGPQERWIVGDLLHEILRFSDVSLRRRVALRLADILDAPSGLVRSLAIDTFEVAEPILERSQTLTDFDLLEVIRAGQLEHRIAIAKRDRVSEVVTASLIKDGEFNVVTAVLRNAGAHIAPPTLDHLVTTASDEASFVPLIMKRAELRPRAAMRLFWSAPHKDRLSILERFGVDRTLMIEAVDDVFAMAAHEAEPDPLVSRALVFVDRRQRDRNAMAKSAYGTLEKVFETMAREGATPDLIEAASQIASISRPLLARMFDDPGGEPLAVLVKATGADRECLVQLWRALGRPETAPAFAEGMIVHDSLSVERAQTILRYWDWANLGKRNQQG
ncbi:MAG: hypothetical protein CMF74_08500 [Maricaulis sp.]|jgi:uncharacterized protein (DUF2336 family)|nr:hypothetical protein [Maricaulis sp.]